MILALVLVFFTTRAVTNAFLYQVTTINKALTLETKTVVKLSNTNENSSRSKTRDSGTNLEDLRTRFAGADDPETEEATLYQGVQDRESHILLLDRSLRNLTGRGITDRVGSSNDDDDICALLTSSRYALYSHGVLKPEMIDGPVNNFANFGALATFGVTYKQFVQIPSSRIAPPGFHQIQLCQTLEALELGTSRIAAEGTQQRGVGGFIEGYCGMRNRLDLQHQGFTFRINDAVLWNIFDDEGKYCGQATFFDREAIEICLI